MGKGSKAAALAVIGACMTLAASAFPAAGQAAGKPPPLYLETPPGAKPRVVITADPELDDSNSLVRYLLFGDDEDQRALTGDGWLARQQVQFHWTGDGQPRAFADYLATLQREKRKKIQQEQRKVADAGVRFTALRGAAITPEDWDFFYECYTLTYLAHRNKPYLTRDFFARMAADLPEHWLMFVARDASDERVAASLVAIDAEQRAAYGRYWGSTRYIPNLHFDACYYQPLAWCLENGWRRFEGGAQGEHKMARGLMPVATRSAHWLAHPQFREAVADFLDREGQAMDEYIDELERHQPFKAPRTDEASAED